MSGVIRCIVMVSEYGCVIFTWMNQSRNGSGVDPYLEYGRGYALISEIGGSMPLYGNATTPHGAKIEHNYYY